MAVRLAESRSDAVQRLVLISGGAPVPLEYEWSIVGINPDCLSLFTPCIRLGFQRQVNMPCTVIVPMLAFSKRGISSRSNSESQSHCSADSAERKAAFQFNAYTLWATMAGQKWPEGDRHFYGRLHVPVLLICGCQDRLVSEAEEEEALFSLRCAQLRRLPKAGHMGMLEDPNQVNEFIEEHIINPPHPLGLSKRNQSYTFDGLPKEPITSQPNCGALLDDGTSLNVINETEHARERNSNCGVDTDTDSPCIASIFRPRIHSKRWRSSKKSTPR
ncbi:unnamed protein product [Hydatigera taeniaeformis]|uniref:AB hydrolase-1 domain-containing protein n=1 Tax=Hydatigena taeniaeformis TaxID=6205 RepID=A0A3P7ESG4_HYDTA|nr:unnamed protein product [Hydatigera taeniaeformis]